MAHSVSGPPDGDDAGLVSGGVDVAERERFAALQMRAAQQGFVLLAVRSGFLLQRTGWLRHTISLESIVALLGAEEQRPKAGEVA